MSTSIAAAQQSGQPKNSEEKFLDSNVPDFELRNQTLVDGVWKLAKAPAPFAFGFENVLKKRLADAGTSEPGITLKVNNKTVREVLDALCEADPRFTWSMDGATVNVFPRAVINDDSYLLNRRLEKFELRNATDVDQGLFEIPRQLPPPMEQVAHAQTGGGDPYPPVPWTVTYYNLSVRQVVNRLAAHGGPCGIWIFGGAQDFRAFGFFNTYLHCSTEPSGSISKASAESSARP